jgi:hypothetical protein
VDRLPLVSAKPQASSKATNPRDPTGSRGFVFLLE